MRMGGAFRSFKSMADDGRVNISFLPPTGLGAPSFGRYEVAARSKAAEMGPFRENPLSVRSFNASGSNSPVSLDGSLYGVASS